MSEGPFTVAAIKAINDLTSGRKKVPMPVWQRVPRSVAGKLERLCHPRRDTAVLNQPAKSLTRAVMWAIVSAFFVAAILGRFGVGGAWPLLLGELFVNLLALLMLGSVVLGGFWSRPVPSRDADVELP